MPQNSKLNSAMEEKKCTKVKFSSQKYADFHIKTHQYKNANGNQVKSYKCPICPNSWHITTKATNDKLVDDNCKMFETIQEQAKLIKQQAGQIKSLKHTIAQKGRSELKEEIVVQSLEHILNHRQQYIQDLESRNKQLVSARDQLLFKLSNTEK